MGSKRRAIRLGGYRGMQNQYGWQGFQKKGDESSRGGKGSKKGGDGWVGNL